MDFNKFFSQESPLLTLPKHETLNTILDCIYQQNQFPQDAIQGEMFQEALVGFPKIMIGVINKFRITHQDVENILAGYTQALMALNVAIRARSEGEESAINYVRQIENVGERNYYIAHLSQLKEALIQDYTSASIFEYCSKSPIKSDYYYLLGIELAKINFGIYGSEVIKSMNDKYSGIGTMRIWMGMS
jgi:hypothetical protein